HTKVCRLLLDNGANVDIIDENNESCITFMLNANMVHMAKRALNKLHVKDSDKRCQKYQLDILEPERKNKKGYARSPLQVIVDNNLFELIDHPVIKQISKRKWKKFA
ncbi:uncharacterized protein LOC144357607, partial [Saccoglossus kowalevskii]